MYFFWHQISSLSVLPGHPANSPVFLLFQCSAVWTQSIGMVLSDDNGSEKEITRVRQESPPQPLNNHCCTTMAMPPLPSWFPQTLFLILWSNHPSAASADLLSLQHGHTLPVEAIFPEAGLLPGQFWIHLGNDAAALHHSATSQPREQRCAEAANPGPQQALHKGFGWREPECHGWTLCGHHDGLRWVKAHWIINFSVRLSALRWYCYIKCFNNPPPSAQWYW